MKRLLLLIFVLTLPSCSFLPTKTIYVDRTITTEPFHPAKPTPLRLELPPLDGFLVPKNKDELLKDDTNYTFALYSWEKYLDLGANLNMILAKFEEYEIMLCYYRKSLKEPECEGKVAPDPVQPVPNIEERITEKIE